MPETFKFVEDRFAPPAPLPSTTQDTSKLETFDFVDEFEPVQPAPEVEEFEEMVTEFDRDGKEVSLPVYDDAGKRLHRPKYEKDTGRMTHNERGVMTYDEWLKQKNEGDVDWWEVATGAVKHLAGGFTKIPGKIKEEGVMEASANIPESFLAAMEGVRMISGGAGRLIAKPFRTEEEENKAEYEAYAEFGDQIFRQLELRKSRMGDVARMFGAKELAEVYDDGIDPEVADSLSLIFDPTYLVGGGLVKVGAAGMRHVPKVTNKYAKQVMAAASKAANTKIGAAGGKALKEVGQRVATPITSFVSGSGKAGEMLGRGMQKGAKIGEKVITKAPAVGVIGGGALGYFTAPEGRELEGLLTGAVGGGALGTGIRYGGQLGESLEKTAQRIGGAAEAAKINSVRVSGLGTVAKTRKMRDEVAKQFVKYDNRVANKLLSGAAKIADTATVGAGMGAGIGSLMPTDPNNPGWAAGLGIGTFAAPIGLGSAKALSKLARVEISRGGVPSADVRLRIKETPDHQLASEAVVERFAAGLPEEQRVRFVDPDRGLSVHDMATQAEAVNWAMGAKRYAGKDVDLFVGNAQEVVAQTGKPFHESVAGFYWEDTNKIYINTDAEVSTMTLLHEVFHPTETWSSRQKKFDTELEEAVDVDPLQDLQTDLVQTIVGTYAPDGSQIKAGLYSADELGKLIDQYNSKLYPDQKSNIIAKKAEIAAEFKKSGGADTPDLTLMNRELDELTIKQDDRVKELAAFDLLPESEKRNFIAREILSEQFAMFGESARHGIIRKARNIALKKDYFRDKFLGMEIDRLKFNTLGRVRKTLEQVGVKFDLAGNPRGDMTATSVIFKDPKTGRQMVVDPGVEHLIAQYIIEKDKLVNRVSETAEVGGSEVTFKAGDAAKKNKDGTPKVPRAIIERWAESGWVKTDKSGDIVNSTGGKWQPGQRPAFTTARERTRMDKDRVAALVAALEPVTKQIGDEEESVGAVRWRETADGGKNFSGGHFDDAQMAAIMNTPDDVVRPVFKENIRMMNEAVKSREGQPFLADYWKAITGKGYDSKARMKVQLFTPIGMSISSHGNFNATVFNIGYFENKINRWLGQSGKKKFWKEWADEDGRVDVDAFRNDMIELLGTHLADDPAKRFPEGVKKEKMYSFLGIKPFEPGRKDWNVSAKDRRMIHFLRTDRMQKLTPGMGENFPINYGKSRARYMPREATRPPVDEVGVSDAKFMPGVEKFDTIEPSIISESVKIKPGAFDNVRFMPGAARIPLAKVAESDPFIMASDRMADMVYEVPGSGVKIELHGGPDFSYRDGDAVWASTRNAATKIGNYVERSGKNRALIMVQRGDNHAKNPSMGQVFVEELKAREKNITKTDMNKMLRAASKRAGLKKAIKNVGELENAYQFWDWETRGNFFGQFGLVNKPHSPIGDPRKRGFFDFHQIIKDTTSPHLLDLPTGSVVGAIEFDGGKIYSASELGTVPHTSYDAMLKGRGLGLFENPPHISEILDVPESQRSVFTLSRRFTSPNRLKETAQAEVDNIIKMPTEEKAKRKDRAQKILDQVGSTKKSASAMNDTKYMPGTPASETRNKTLKSIETEAAKTVEQEKSAIETYELNKEELSDVEAIENYILTANKIDVSADIVKRSEDDPYVVSYSAFGNDATGFDTVKTLEQAKEYAREFVENEIGEYHTNSVNSFRRGELLEDLWVPENWEIEDVRDTQHGTIYFKINEILEKDADGDVIDSNEYKIRIGDHDPSPFREKEFGRSDFVVEVSNLSAKELNRAIGKVESWLKKKSDE